MKREWHWITEPSDGPLPDLSLFTDPEAGCTVKRSLFRSVRRVTAPDGTVFFVKHDTPRTPLRILKELLRPKGLSEYRSGKLLRSAGIPCVSFAALGRRFPESVLVSRELSGYISSWEFRYVAGEQEIHRFLRALAGMIRRMLDAGIVHPDLHAGNVMVRREDPEDLRLLDPFGVRRGLYTPFRADCRVFCDFADLMTPDEASELFRIMGADPRLWIELQEQTRRHIWKEWPRRAGQILSGRSKFLRTETLDVLQQDYIVTARSKGMSQARLLDGELYYIRNTPWYTPKPFSPGNAVSEEMEPDTARDIWLNSFRAALLGEKMERIPCAFRPGKTRSLLYYDKADS